MRRSNSFGSKPSEYLPAACSSAMYEDMNDGLYSHNNGILLETNHYS